jgi:hypothetical protein
MEDVRKLDTDKEFVLTVDSTRSITVTPTTDGESVVIAVEDPHSVAVVELSMDEVAGLVEGLQRPVRGE